MTTEAKPQQAAREMGRQQELSRAAKDGWELREETGPGEEHTLTCRLPPFLNIHEMGATAGSTSPKEPSPLGRSWGDGEMFY